MSSVVLVDPKYAHNVGGVLRACSVWGIERLIWTGWRVPAPDQWPKGWRLPREERMRLYRNVELEHKPQLDGLEEAATPLLPPDGVPIAVELRDAAEDLVEFRHPRDAIYVFGPEDGSLDRGTLTACHRFVRIPSAACLNLAAAVNVVLYDRYAKARIEEYV